MATKKTTKQTVGQVEYQCLSDAECWKLVAKDLPSVDSGANALDLESFKDVATFCLRKSYYKSICVDDIIRLTRASESLTVLSIATMWESFTKVFSKAMKLRLIENPMNDCDTWEILNTQV
jgi:hypothetical protein